jgi:hypothetical protein
VLVGEWAHNVRGALDYLAYELVRRETGEDDPRWTQFPIVVEELPYPDQERQRLQGASLVAACVPWAAAIQRRRRRAVASACDRR